MVEVYSIANPMKFMIASNEYYKYQSVIFFDSYNAFKEQVN